MWRRARRSFVAAEGTPATRGTAQPGVKSDQWDIQRFRQRDVPGVVRAHVVAKRPHPPGEGREGKQGDAQVPQVLERERGRVLRDLAVPKPHASARSRPPRASDAGQTSGPEASCSTAQVPSRPPSTSADATTVASTTCVTGDPRRDIEGSKPRGVSCRSAPCVPRIRSSTSPTSGCAARPISAALR